MSRSSRGAWLLASLLPLVPGCTEPATALVVAIRSSEGVAGALDSISIEVKRGDEVRFSRSYITPEDVRLPATLTLARSEDRPTEETISVRVVGRQGGTRTRIERQGRLRFVEQKTKLLRFDLTSDCLDVTCKTPNTTCISGQCTDDSIDPETLPDFESNDAANVPFLPAAGASGAGQGGAGQGGAGQGGQGGENPGGAGQGGAGGAGEGGGGAGTGGVGGGGSAGEGGAGEGGAGGAGQGGAGQGGGGGGGAVPPTDSRLSVGKSLNCFVAQGTPDDGVHCWGLADRGRIYPTSTPEPPSFTPRALRVVGLDAIQKAPIWSVSAAAYHACAIVGPGRELACWGSNEKNALFATNLDLQLDPFVTDKLQGVAQVSLHYRGGCARLAQGGENVRCWGNANTGLLLKLGATDSPVPVVIPGVIDAAQIELTKAFGMACARQLDGKVLCWGGLQSQTADDVPTDVGLDGAVEIAAGEELTTVAARGADGMVTFVTRDIQTGAWSSPQPLLDDQGQQLGPVTRLAAGNSICGLQGDRTVTCFQRNRPRATISFPQERKVIELSAGYTEVFDQGVQCALLDDASVWCWGHNWRGALGNDQPDMLRSAQPVQAGFSAQTAVSGVDMLGLTTPGGELRVWGQSQALFGDRVIRANAPLSITSIASDPASYRYVETPNYTAASEPAYAFGDQGAVVHDSGNAGQTRLLASGLPISGMSGVDGIDLGIRPGQAALRVLKLSAFTDSSGILATVTSDASGDLIALPEEPAEVVTPSIPGLQLQHVCVRGASSGTVTCWGANNAGQTGTGLGHPVPTPSPVSTTTGLTGASALCAGDDFTCAIASATGKVFCWGKNNSWAVLPGNSEDQPLPKELPGLGAAQGISCGSTFVCAWAADKVTCWGNNAMGQLGDPAVPLGVRHDKLVAVQGLPAGAQIKRVVTGPSTACALLDSGAVRCWGSNFNGQAAQPQTGFYGDPQQVLGLP